MKNPWLDLYMFYLPTSDFLEVGFAHGYDQIVESMKKRCDIVYGKSNKNRYAASIIYKATKGMTRKKFFHALCSPDRDEAIEQTEYHVRFTSGWMIVNKEIYDKFADKWVGQVDEE